MAAKQVLGRDFFDGDALEVANSLLGKFLVRDFGDHKEAFMITEVEAYDGLHDKASHAHKGETLRNRPMFGEGGHWYVYFVYGAHWMLNIVTGPKKYPAAVLIRGVSGISGPGRITKRLKIDRSFNGLSANRKNCLWIEDRGIKIPQSRIKTSPRIGVSYAKEWAKKPYRFFLDA